MTAEPLVHVVAMGVSGTGKSTVAAAVATELGLELVEGDDHHPDTNRKKMADGIPLTDADRLPWLRKLAALVERKQAEGTPTVLSCSALRRSYRDVLRAGAAEIFFLHLHADFDVLLERMGERKGHFMPASLLQSQFDTLEPLGPDESGTMIDVTPSVAEVTAKAVRAIRAMT